MRFANQFVKFAFDWLLSNVQPIRNFVYKPACQISLRIFELRNELSNFGTKFVISPLRTMFLPNILLLVQSVQFLHISARLIEQVAYTLLEYNQQRPYRTVQQRAFRFQVAQFILDDAIMKDKGSTCRIMCTQPRRISAISVSDYQFISIIISWLPEFLLSLQVKLITNKPSMT